MLAEFFLRELRYPHPPVPEDAVDYFPKWLSRLDGKRIRIRGFMYPPYEETGIEAFMLARDNQISIQACRNSRNLTIGRERGEDLAESVPD